MSFVLPNVIYNNTKDGMIIAIEKNMTVVL